MHQPSTILADWARQGRRLATVAILAAASLAPAAALAQDKVLEFPSFQADEASSSVWWKAVIADFESRHPGVKVDFSNSPGGRHTDLLATRFAANRPPPIVHMISRDFVGFAAQGWFDEIDSCFTDDTLSHFGGLQSFMKWDGKTLGLLLNSYAYHLFYNADLLAKAGTKVPTTIEELASAVEAVNALGGDVTGFAGVTRSEGDAFVQASIFATGEGTPWVTEAGYNVTDAKFVATMDAFRRIHAKAPQGFGELERNQLFFSGKAAMMIDGNYFWQQALDSAEPGVKEHLGMAALPFPFTPGSVSNSLHIPAGLDAETRALVCDFIATAASEKFQESYGETLSVPPPRDGATTDALRAKFPEQIALMIEEKNKAVSVLPDSEKVMTNYGVFVKLAADSVVELFASDRPTADILADLKTRLDQQVPLT
jgi:multiple sugar transport system substrate-binding protein